MCEVVSLKMGNDGVSVNQVRNNLSNDWIYMCVNIQNSPSGHDFLGIVDVFSRKYMPIFHYLNEFIGHKEYSIHTREDKKIKFILRLKVTLHANKEAT